MEEIITDILHKNLGSKKVFTNVELENVLKAYYAKPYHKTTYRWRIHDLKSRGIVQNVGRGIYAFPQSIKDFAPAITTEARKIYEEIQTSLPFLTIALTDTAWFNEFTVQQVFKTYIIIYVEKGSASSVFNNLQAEYRQSYLNPGREIFENYMTTDDQPLIIQSMISEAPLTQSDKMNISSLEKLLVDFVSDHLLYAAQQEETEGIYKTALEKYPVNIAKLKRYARRRNKEDRVSELLNNIQRK